MESNVFWDIIKIVIGSGLGIAIATIIPLLFQLRKEKEEKAKIKADTSNVSADAASKIVTAASNLQDAYVELLNDMKAKTIEYKEEIDNLSDRIRELEISNKELKRKIEESTTIINELIKGVHLLTEQIENLGQQPSWNREGG